MEKNKYVVPNMVVVEFKHQSRLLAGSPGSDNEETYIPNMSNDLMNKLA